MTLVEGQKLRTMDRDKNANGQSWITQPTTVLPWFTRLLWQIKNRVNQNSRYTSHSMDKIIVKKMSKKFL